MSGVEFAVPPGACDCHVHVFPDARRFPFVEKRVYTPPPAPVRDLNAYLASLGLERVIVIQPSIYDTDNTALMTSSLGVGDIVVKGAGGYARVANFVSVDSTANGTARTATYEVKGPRGEWNRRHNGVYTIWISNNQVKDTSGNFLPGQQIGTFTVRVPPVVSAPAPAATKHHKTATNSVLK